MITTTFEPSAEHRTLATNLQVDIETELAAFVRFNQDREVTHPEKAFTGWIRRAGSNRRSSTPTPAAEKPKPPDPVEDFKREEPEQYQRILEYLESHTWWTKCSPSLQREELRQAIRDRHIIFEHPHNNAR